MKVTKKQLEGIIKQALEEALSKMGESAPPGMEKVVKALKKKGNVENPWAVAWSMYNKDHKKKEDLEEAKWMQKATHPSRKGEFTEKAKEAGMSVQQYATHVLSQARQGKWKGDKKTVQQAKFAKAAKSVSKK